MFSTRASWLDYFEYVAKYSRVGWVTARPGGTDHGHPGARTGAGGPQRQARHIGDALVLRGVRVPAASAGDATTARLLLQQFPAAAVTPTSTRRHACRRYQPGSRG